MTCTVSLDQARSVTATFDLLPHAPVAAGDEYAAIEFIGRKDSRVKVRGHRIELGEIEETLAKCPSVRKAVVVVREESLGGQRLIAYLVGGLEGQPSLSELRAFLEAKLPDFMIPSAFVLLEALPLTPNRKIDRRALPAPDSARPNLDDAYVAPRTPAEREEPRARHPEQLGDEAGERAAFSPRPCELRAPRSR